MSVEEEGHTALFCTCIEFLSDTITRSEDEGGSLLKVRKGNGHSLIGYAARHMWTHLSRSGPPTAEKLRLLDKFFLVARGNLFYLELTTLLGIDYRVCGQIASQTSLRQCLSSIVTTSCQEPSSSTCLFKQSSIVNPKAIKAVEDGLLALHRAAVKLSVAKYRPTT